MGDDVSTEPLMLTKLATKHLMFLEDSTKVDQDHASCLAIKTGSFFILKNKELAGKTLRDKEEKEEKVKL